MEIFIGLKNLNLLKIYKLELAYKALQKANLIQLSDQEVPQQI